MSSNTLASRTLRRPLDPSDIIPREEIISLEKYATEGCMEEQKTVLGWIINSRSLTIALPSHKHCKWRNEIQRIIILPKVKAKDLETIPGCLNHVACIFNPMRHFLGRIYQVFYRANHITLRKTTHIYHSNSSEFGMGGYNLTSGVAWRFKLPADCQLRASINSLEFIACIINIWVDIFHGVLDPKSCLLSQTDSSSASGLLHKTNFADKIDEAIQLATASKLATLLLESDSSLYSQLFPGKKTSVSDSFSHDFKIPDSHLSFLLESYFPEQARFGLRILPLQYHQTSFLG